MWGAAWQIMQGFCSDDGFGYFQPWLVGLAPARLSGHSHHSVLVASAVRGDVGVPAVE
jgi:hypothetical protein